VDETVKRLNEPTEDREVKHGRVLLSWMLSHFAIENEWNFIFIFSHFRD